MATATEPRPASPAGVRPLFVAGSLDPGSGGIQRVARLMARVLADEFGAGGPAAVLTLKDPGTDRPVPARGCGGSKLRLVWRAARAGCTHLMTDSANLGRVQWVPGLRGKPHLTFLHGIEVWEGAEPRWVRSARAATVPVFNSHYTRTRAEALHGPFPRAEVCWLATETDGPAPPRAGGTADVLIVSRLEEDYKGHRELIAAWPAVAAAVPGATLRVVGRGPDRPALEALAAGSGAGDRVVFEGFVTEDRLADLYARAAVFAMPSRGEGFGLVYVEAMRHGLPVVASRHDAAPEVVLDGETGFAVNLDAPGELADRLTKLLRDPDLAARLGAAGRRRWDGHFRYARFRDRFAGILRSFFQTRGR